MTAYERRENGITLIELMIVVAIIGIIAAIAYPSYNQYVTKSIRSVGQSWLTQVANRQEQFRVDNKTYATSMTQLGFPVNPLPVDTDGQPNGSGTIAYNIVIESASGNAFNLQAVPQGGHAERDTDCATLTLNQRGIKGATGTTPAECW